MFALYPYCSVRTVHYYFLPFPDKQRQVLATKLSYLSLYISKLFNPIFILFGFKKFMFRPLGVLHCSLSPCHHPSPKKTVTLLFSVSRKELPQKSITCNRTLYEHNRTHTNNMLFITLPLPKHGSAFGSTKYTFAKKQPNNALFSRTICSLNEQNLHYQNV